MTAHLTTTTPRDTHAAPGTEGVTALIHLAAADAPARLQTLDADGGFAWWYVDMIDARGNGLVLIWSFGLPFLPGYTSAARAGGAPAARTRPSLNVARYEQRRCTFYQLLELDEREASWHVEPGANPGDRTEIWTLGDSRITSTHTAGRVELTVHLDCPIAQSARRLKLDVTGTGARARLPANATDADEHALHLWAPLAVRLDVDVSFDTGGSAPERWRGRAYHDRNDGLRHIDGFDIDHWIWGRSIGPALTRVWYLLWPRGGADPVCLGLEVGDDGSTRLVTDLTVRPGTARRRLWGMTHWPELVLLEGDRHWLTVTTDAVVDDGPFYLRVVGTASAPGVAPTPMLGELVRPDRVDLARHRPLVRMRVHRSDGRNSWWLPLFSGPARTRIRRLLRLEPTAPALPDGGTR